MSANSIDTRLKYLKTFYLWLIENEIYQIKKSVYSIEREKFDTPKVSLTKADLMQIMALKDLTAKQQTVIDMFICNSLMGFRWSDMIQLTKENIMMHPTGETYIRQTNQKTKTTVQIEVQPTSLNILKKYDYEFPKMSLRTYNTKLLKIFTDNNLFPELVIIQERTNSKVKDIQVPRRNLIHSHTSRRNFVNICLDNHVPVNQIMKSTGHKTLSVLMGYATMKTEVQAFAGIDLMTA
jgi:integrase